MGDGALKDYKQSSFKVYIIYMHKGIGRWLLMGPRGPDEGQWCT